LAKEGLVKNGQQMDRYVEEKEFAGWFETSAKDDSGINEACQFLVKQIIDRDQGTFQRDDDVKKITSKTDDAPGEKPSGGCCGSF
jgi:Ras-related protein Rab-32